MDRSEIMLNNQQRKISTNIPAHKKALSNFLCRQNTLTLEYIHVTNTAESVAMIDAAFNVLFGKLVKKRHLLEIKAYAITVVGINLTVK